MKQATNLQKRMKDRACEALARDLSKAMQGGAAGDAFMRSRYATDASIYQIMPLVVAYPRVVPQISAGFKKATLRT